MTLRQKILLLGLLAVTGMFFALWLQYRSYAAQSRSIEVVALNVKAAAALSLATHTLQIERGRTVIGQSKASDQTLAELVGDTDAALSRLALMGAGIASLGETLAQLRSGVAAGTMASLVVLDSYSGLLQTLIDEMGRLTRESEAAVAKTDISAHTHLVAAKEYLGQSRATLGYWIDHGRDDPAVVTRLIRLKSLYDEEMRKFELQASPEVRKMFAVQFSGQQVEQTLSTLAQIATTGQLPQDLGVHLWWSMASAAINHLKAVEDYSLQSIETKAGSELAQLWQAMRFGVIATLLFGIAVIALAASATLTLIRTLNRALASIDRISASQDFRSRIPANTPDEIGRMSRSFNQLLDIAERLLTEKDSLANTDPLTGLNNRLRFAKVLGEEAERKRRTGAPMALVIFDIDRFKRINDTYGHNVGDEVLKNLADIIGAEIRSTDFFARWGGEEFVVLLRDDDCAAAIVAAEKLRKLIASTDFPVVGKVRCSFGVTAWQQGDTEASFVARADKALYASKAGGRNRVSYTQEAWSVCSGRVLCPQ